MTRYILCGALIDGAGAEPLRTRQRRRGRQIAIINASDVPHSGAEVIDLSERTVLPGLIDSHEHLIVDPGDEAAQCAEPVTYLSMKATWNARAILKAGITTMRDVGERYFIDVEAKRCIEAGLIQGPRLLISGHPIIRTGGHAHFLGRETDGVGDMRKAVREAQAGRRSHQDHGQRRHVHQGFAADLQEFSDEETSPRRRGAATAVVSRSPPPWGPALKV